MKLNENNDGSSAYRIPCGCGCNDHDLSMWVEVDDNIISVTHYVEVSTDYWSTLFKQKYSVKPDWLCDFLITAKSWANGLWSRIKLTRAIWFKGYVKFEACTLLNKQQALNYAETIRLAITQIEEKQKTTVARN